MEDLLQSPLETYSHTLYMQQQAIMFYRLYLQNEQHQSLCNRAYHSHRNFYCSYYYYYLLLNNFVISLLQNIDGRLCQAPSKVHQRGWPSED